MIGLLIKDIILTRRTWSFVYLFPVVMVTVLGFITSPQNPAFAMLMVAVAVATIFAFQVSMTFSFDESVKWERMVAAMPVSGIDLVVSKYLLAIVLSGLSLVVCVALGLLITVFTSMSPLQVVEFSLIGLAFGLLYDAVLLPIVFKFGVSKSKYVLMALIYGFVLVPLLLNQFGLSFDYLGLLENISVLGLVALGVVVIFCVSFALSSAIAVSRDGSDV